MKDKKDTSGFVKKTSTLLCIVILTYFGFKWALIIGNDIGYVIAKEVRDDLKESKSEKLTKDFLTHIESKEGDYEVFKCDNSATTRIYGVDMPKISCIYINDLQLKTVKEDIYNSQSYTVIDSNNDTMETYTLNKELEKIIILFPDNIITTIGEKIWIYLV